MSTVESIATAMHVLRSARTLQVFPRRTALPLLLSLRYPVYWRGNSGDYIVEEPVLLRRELLHAHRWCQDGSAASPYSRVE